MKKTNKKSLFSLPFQAIAAFLLYAITFTYAFFISFVLVLVFWAPYRLRYSLILVYSYLMIYLAKWLCGVRYRVTGFENLPKNTSAIVLCKHQSAWETLFLQVLLPPQCWVLKRKVVLIPFFGWGLWTLRPIVIPAKKRTSFKFLIDQGKQKLKQGCWVIIFPEGTRVKPGEHKQYSRSGTLLAVETGYPIVPIAHNAGVFWPKSSFLKRPGVIDVVIGPCIHPGEKNATVLISEVESWIESTVANLPQE